MGEVAGWVAFAVAFIIGMPALWMLGRGLWPEAFSKRLVVSQNGIFKSMLIGLLPFALSIALIAASGKKLGIVALLLAAAILVWGLMGSSGIASLVGERLWPSSDPWRQTRNGGLVVICCAVLPLFGWFLFLPFIAIVGMGVNVRCMFSRNKTAVEAPSVPV